MVSTTQNIDFMRKYIPFEPPQDPNCKIRLTFGFIASYPSSVIDARFPFYFGIDGTPSKKLDRLLMQYFSRHLVIMVEPVRSQRVT